MRGGLRDKLEYHYLAFDRSQLSPDPLEFPHRFSNEKEIELVAFICSIFAFGSVSLIGKVLEEVFGIMKWKPLDYVRHSSESEIARDFKGTTHRFYTSEDIVLLVKILSGIYAKGETLRSLFQRGNVEGGIKEAISEFHKYFLSEAEKKKGLTNGARFMFPLPEKGSACKRINLFLRWMVRKDELDFGFWNFIMPSELIIPVDTHIARIARELKLTKLKNVSWKMAEEITENLRKYDKNDPIKYDFALCHIGIRKKEF